MVLISLPVAGYFLIQSSRVQTYLTQIVAERISSELDAKFHVGKVDITLFNKVVLEDIYIEDQMRDTLLEAEKLTATIHYLNLRNKQVLFDNIELGNARVNVYTDSAGVGNTRFLANALERETEGSGIKNWEIYVNSITLSDSRFSGKMTGSPSTPEKVNFSDLDLKSINMKVSNFDRQSDTVLFNVNHLSFEDKSGFTLKNFSSEASISNDHILNRRLNIETEKTSLQFDSLQLGFDGFEAFNDFANEVELSASVNPSRVHFEDLALFIPDVPTRSEDVRIEGTIRGMVNNLKGDKVNISLSHETSMLGCFNVMGLPDIKHTYIFMDLHRLSTSAEDMDNILASFETGREYIPKDLRELGQLNYQGNFTGFIDDFVAYGKLTTDLGEISTDLSIRPDTSNTLVFNGEIATSDFHAGKLMQNDDIGEITFNASASGYHSPAEGLNADLSGIINFFEIMGYDYRNIDLSGSIKDRNFEGSASVKDANINFSFDGGMDFSGETPVFDFSADVLKAHLYNLNLSRSDPEYTVSFGINANFKGSNIDNLEGEIKMEDAHFEKSDRMLRVDSFSLHAYPYEEKRKIELNSDFANGEITGQYEFATLANSLDQILSHYIPSYGKELQDSDETGNDFDFTLELGNTSQVTGFFLPELQVAEGTKIKGSYSPSENNLDFTGHSPQFSFNNHTLSNLEISAGRNEKQLLLKSNVENAKMWGNNKIENIDIISAAFDDSLTLQINWNNETSREKYKGEFIAGAGFENIPGKVVPGVMIDIKPSEIVIADSTWNMSQSSIKIDSTSMAIENFRFSNKNQSLEIDGMICERPEDSLSIHFSEIDIATLNQLNVVEDLSLEGFLSGKASVCDIYGNTSLQGGLTVSKLRLNEQDFGDLTILSDWNNRTESVYVNAFSERDGEKIIDIYGTYGPESRELDFSGALSKVNLKAFDKYEDEVFVDLEGYAGGDLHLGGTLQDPRFNGNIALEDATFTVDYLQSRFNFSHDVNIIDNQIIFNDITVYDQEGNTCLANGSVTHENLEDFNLDITLEPESFMALNTTQRDNRHFYGRLFASGVVNIEGPTDNLNIDISASTERNTRLFIPVNQEREAHEHHFVRFTSQGNNDNEEEEDPESTPYEVDLSGINLDFGLEVTPDAEAQIIFGSRLDDVIRGRGAGSLKMEIDAQGRFNIFGDYVFEEGDYLFTLQNVVNKRFDIERGSTITWSGNPEDANIDMTAKYRLRAPLNNLDSELGLQLGDRTANRVPVECEIYLKNRLVNPNIEFDINLPTADTQTRQYVDALLNTEEKLNRQFISLLVINNFLPAQEYARSPALGGSLGTSATGAGMATASEFLSSQLSSWLSELSGDVDLGVNFRPGDEITPDEMEVALSTQLFNERVTIDGSVDVGERQTRTSNIVGDVDVDIRLSRSGKLRMKVFTRSNDNLLRPNLAPYTQGVGFFYREDFDSFDKLLQNYWRNVFPAKEDGNE